MAFSRGGRLMSNKKCKLPEGSTKKATAVLSILGSESSFRDCENQLTVLFDHQGPDLTTKLRRSRDAIVWCTKLADSDAGKRPRRQAVLWMSTRVQDAR